MRTTPRHSTRAAWWMLGAVLVFGCAKGSMLETGAGGGGIGGGSVTTTSSGTLTTSSSSSGSTTTSSSSSSSGSTTTSSSSSSSSTTSSSSSSSSTTSSSSNSSSGTVCTSPQHLCNGSCAGNTPDTGCTLSASCAPCPMPTANGTATCTANGVCDLQCSAGYQPNATKTDCEAIQLTQCCDDSACPIFMACLDGYCRNPLASACDPARCNDFCKCTAGGTPQSTGMCNFDVFVWECLCSP